MVVYCPLSDIVTCMALDKAGTGEHLITGSRDTTCVIWRFTNNVTTPLTPPTVIVWSLPLQEVSEHPLVTLYGHDSEVLCVDISTELGMAVSGAKVCPNITTVTLTTITPSLYHRTVHV